MGILMAGESCPILKSMPVSSKLFHARKRQKANHIVDANISKRSAFFPLRCSLIISMRRCLFSLVA